ncbi:ACP S-malonyltransferase [Halanaerobiaceae bacterium Z-7014]|uniref:Malonyl CoA-acyl carrier protein transacylase n=1 Tax=Halonatronomonas betaini TaxID=2778430 RepID=A0A931APU7_9FIRM|nr:ACP S-malonyltransferase [Halonatronomonas betaini]MBF8436773.1 ACP S-malonyltransferase [Halonatronomonas betaini]
MSKIGFIFPGQGAQEVGMGQELYNKYPEIADYFNRAEEILNLDLKRICFEGPEFDLNLTENTQPALFTMSAAIDDYLKKQGLVPDMVAGHSLGEYSALTSAGAINFEDNLKLVRQRGQAMEEALPAGLGTMAAIIGLDIDTIEDICSKVVGVCEVANINTPNQIVISGEKEAVATAMERLNNAGAKKVVELSVSGPFHSSLMEPAVNRLKSVIENVEIKDASIPIVANATAEKVIDSNIIEENLIAQLTSSVRWVESINLMIDEGIDTFVEVGSGRVLKGLLRRIDRSVDCYSTRNIKDLEKIIGDLI